jgi:hypothetical protein
MNAIASWKMKMIRKKKRKKEKDRSQMYKWNLLGIYVDQRDERLFLILFPSTKLHFAPSTRCV